MATTTPPSVPDIVGQVQADAARVAEIAAKTEAHAVSAVHNHALLYGAIAAGTIAILTIAGLLIHKL